MAAEEWVECSTGIVTRPVLTHSDALVALLALVDTFCGSIPVHLGVLPMTLFRHLISRCRERTGWLLLSLMVGGTLCRTLSQM